MFNDAVVLQCEIRNLLVLNNGIFSSLLSSSLGSASWIISHLGEGRQPRLELTERLEAKTSLIGKKAGQAAGSR